MEAEPSSIPPDIESPKKFKRRRSPTDIHNDPIHFSSPIHSSDHTHPSQLQNDNYPKDPNLNIWSYGTFKEKVIQAPPKKVIYVGSDDECDSDEDIVDAELSYNNLSGSSEWPKVVVPKNTLRKLWAPWKKALIVKVLGKFVSYSMLRQKIKSLWKLRNELDPVDLGNEYYLIRFSNKEDYDHVLIGGPWSILGHYLTVQKWKPEFRASEAQIESTNVWIRFPEIPIEYFNNEILTIMGNAVGKVSKIDHHTKESLRGRFARVSVEISLHSKLVPFIWINDKLQKVEYEGLHMICFSCGAYGHRAETCSKNGAATANSPTSNSPKVTVEVT